MSNFHYETEVVALVDSIMFGGYEEEQVAEHLSTWDPDDIRALALTAQALYAVARSTWFDKTTQPKDST